MTIEVLVGLALLLIVPLFAFSKRQRKILFAKADAKCEKCGRDWYDGYMLEAHHVKPLVEGGKNTISNGKMLCRECHADAHIELSKKARAKGNKKLANQHGFSARKIREKGLKRWGYE